MLFRSFRVEPVGIGECALRMVGLPQAKPDGGVLRNQKTVENDVPVRVANAPLTLVGAQRFLNKGPSQGARTIGSRLLGVGTVLLDETPATGQRAAKPRIGHRMVAEDS